ncbi:MAG: threonylcarbamoyl-AMP synthase [Phycisphaeraceae bacterium]|nr:threonylcarbamoyl-AMP synthase [Phycisphaeraceae bacterium]
MSEAAHVIRKAAELLRQGRLVAFPTETVYGLGADAFNEGAVRAVFEIKGRPPINPLIVHVSGPEMARRVVADWPDRADALAREFWPGPLTIVLPRASARSRLPAIITAGGPNVAVRCPDHPVALALLFEFGGPLVGPSANPSGTVSPTTAAHVRAGFPGPEVFVLDGGACRGGIESTVLSLAGDVPRILRPGLVSAVEIERVLGERVELGGEVAGATDAPMESPGLLARHYAPRTPARLFESREWPDVLEEEGGGRAVVILIGHREVPAPHVLLAMPMRAEDYAARLYASLREADAAGAERILIERPPEDSALWEAIADRLLRATAD